jgi:hypothetical protein
MGNTSSKDKKEPTIPYSVCLEMEKCYLEGISGGLARSELFFKLEKLYDKLIFEESKLNSPVKIVYSNGLSTYAIDSPISPISNLPNKKDFYHDHEKVDQALTISPSKPKLLSRSPSSVNTARSRSRLLRPKSASYRDPNSIDREKRTNSPRRSSMANPALSMTFECLWKVSWVSVAHRMNLQPLPIVDYPDMEKWPVIDDDIELILLIYLLRSLSREFEGQVLHLIIF